MLITEDMYEDMKKMGSYFDMSEYDKDHPLYGIHLDKTNAKVLGKFKNEYSNAEITHIACPRPKMYGIRSLKIATKRKHPGGPLEYLNDEHGDWQTDVLEGKKAKGITKTAVKNQISFNDYQRVMNENVQTYATMRGIKSTRHVLFTEETVKKALNGLDTKRFAVNNTETLAFGHRLIPFIQSMA
jgi:hypothetical protein